MIRKSAPDRHSPSIRRKVDQLYTCVRYCEDEFRCRRTMQLEFFGERFDRSKCKETCDNCRAGKVPDRRDMTAEALAIIGLFNNVSNQSRRAGGVTMLQLSELYRGSKSQSILRNFKTAGLIGYGAGARYKKFDVERIMHSMIFERLLTESSVENNGGFLSDYVSLGENVSSLQGGARKFFVEFPKSPDKKSEKAAPDSDSKNKRSRAKTGNNRKGAKKKSPDQQPDVALLDEGGLQFAEMADGGDTDDGEDDSLLDANPATLSKSEASNAVLPQNHTTKLVNMIKKLTQLWATEEQTMGNNVHCKLRCSLVRRGNSQFEMVKLTTRGLTFSFAV
jgi:superfamily II DNA helicase RecQ